MIKKILSGILCGLVLLLAGAIAGGFLGLIIGGTFLGGFDIYDRIGLEGYELAMYVGAIIGAVVVLIMKIKNKIKKL